MSRSGVAAVIVAGGTGQRFGHAGGKQLAAIAGRPVLAWTLLAFDEVASIDELVVVCHPERIAEYRESAIAPLGLTKPVKIVAGGDTRQESVAAGLAELSDGVGLVAVHDGARPLVTPATIADAIRMAVESGADGVVVGHPSVDTLKVVEVGRVVETPSRDRFWAVQTPQVFRRDVLEAAHATARSAGFTGTDDASLVERAGGTVLMFEGPRDNIKITTPEDVAFAEAVLAQRGERS